MKNYRVLMQAKKDIEEIADAGDDFEDVFAAESNPQAQILAGNMYGLDDVTVLEVILMEEEVR